MLPSLQIIRDLNRRIDQLEKELARWKPKNFIETPRFDPERIYCTVEVSTMVLLEANNPSAVIDHELKKIKEELLEMIQRR